MAKLFNVSIEEDNNEEGGLLIDRLIKSDAGKGEADSALASNALSEQKAAIKDKVEKAISDSEPTNNTDNEPTDVEPVAEDDTQSTDDVDTEPTKADPTSDSTTKVSKPEGEDEEVTVATDEPKKEVNDDDKKPKTGETEESTESYFKPMVLKHVNFDQVCKPIRSMYATYVSQLGNLKGKSISFEDLPVVYTKEAVIEALNKLCVIIDDSIKAVVDIIEGHKKGLLHLNEKFMALQQRIDKDDEVKKKIINDKDLLLTLAIDTTIDLDESGNQLLQAIISFKNIANIAKKSKYGDLSELFLNDGFKKKEVPTDLEYSYMLPGFTSIKVSLYSYTGFSSNDLDKIGVYALNTVQPSIVEALEPLQIPNKEESISIVNVALKIIEEAVKVLDTLTDITILLNDLLKEVKTNIDTIKGDKVNKLDIPKIDEFFKDLIKNRAIITYGKIIDQATISYLTGLLSFLITGYSIQ